MQRVSIKNRRNLTLLAKAYMSKLFPMARRGQVYYDTDEFGEIDHIFFEDTYYKELRDFVTDIKTMAKMLASNSGDEWRDLVLNTLLESTAVDDFDVGKAELYTLTEFSFDPIKVSDELVVKLLSISVDLTENVTTRLIELEADVKRAYAGLDIIKEGAYRLDIKLPVSFDYELVFPLEPISLFSNKHGFEAFKQRFYKSAKDDVIFITIHLKQRSLQ